MFLTQRLSGPGLQVLGAPRLNACIGPAADLAEEVGGAKELRSLVEALSESVAP